MGDEMVSDEDDFGSGNEVCWGVVAVLKTLLASYQEGRPAPPPPLAPIARYCDPVLRYDYTGDAA